MKRKVDDKTYLTYLFQSLNVNELKQMCRDFNIKGFSRLKKAELVDFILDSLAEEELSELLKEKELEIISGEINLAIKKINGEDRESVSAIKIVNPEAHEVEISFKGFNWEVNSFLSITPDNINDPERDCDCRVGANMGFCSHFWTGFILSLKQGYFKLSDWSLTVLPDNFEELIESIKLHAGTSGEKGKEGTESMSLIDESSDGSVLTKFINASITIYEGEIHNIQEKQQDFQGNITTYYIVSLRNVRIGPRVQRKSDFREEDIKTVRDLNLRISQKLYEDNNLENGDNLGANGKLMKDNFLRMNIVKNIRKIQKI